MTVPTNPQNSISVCHSRPLRARRDASIASTAPTCRSQIAESSRSNPGRANPPPDLPQIIIDDLHTAPSELLGTINKPELPAPTLVIVRQLIRRRLADI